MLWEQLATQLSRDSTFWVETLSRQLRKDETKHTRTHKYSSKRNRKGKQDEAKVEKKKKTERNTGDFFKREEEKDGEKKKTEENQKNNQ